MSKERESIFVEKYRPQTIEECVLPKSLKDVFRKFVDNKEFPNLLLSGGPGIGKTTVAKALCNELGYDWMIINASLNANMDKLRNDISKFASTVSLMNKGAYKVIILDEADHLNHHIQPALRGFIEEFSSNCRFIFTCNYKNKIIAPLRDSRLANIDFNISKKDMPSLMGEFMKHIEVILVKEEIKYDKKVIAELIKKFFPDFRRILNEIQRYGIGGEIDSGILATIGDFEINDLVKHLKNKDFTEMRKWVGSSVDISPTEIYRRIYDTMYEYLDKQSIPKAVLILGDYQYKSAFVADQEINLVACLTELMVECEYV